VLRVTRHLHAVQGSLALAGELARLCAKVLCPVRSGGRAAAARSRSNNREPLAPDLPKGASEAECDLPNIPVGCDAGDQDDADDAAFNPPRRVRVLLVLDAESAAKNSRALHRMNDIQQPCPKHRRQSVFNGESAFHAPARQTCPCGRTNLCASGRRRPSSARGRRHRRRGRQSVGRGGTERAQWRGLTTAAPPRPAVR
jgi:hypothetical protein